MNEPVICASIAEIKRQIDAHNANMAPLLYDGVKVTPEQFTWLRRLCEADANPFAWPTPPGIGTPVRVVPTIEESTPYAEGWTGWPGVS